jgi:hypothetical protein
MVPSYDKVRKEMTSIEKTYSMKRLFGLFVIALVFVSGCYYPAPVYAPGPTSFDRSWDAARGAAYDEGLQITNEDRSSGVITAVRGQQEVTINVFRQADGSIRVEITARGPQGSDSGLADRVSRAYDRRMGR